MQRRSFLAGFVSVFAARLAEAQQAGKVFRVGVLETTSLALNAVCIDAFRRGLRELGYVEGHNLTIEY